MSCRNIIVLSLVAGVIIVCFWLWNTRVSKNEFNALFVKSGHSHIATITFSGQQRCIKVTDPKTLAPLEEAFRNRSSEMMRLGLTYNAVIKFRSGHEFQTFIYVHDDKNGITIANPAFAHAGDSEMILIRFTKPVNSETRALLDALTK
jgi:hypothetical protein